MRLEQELKLLKPIKSSGHEAFLSILRTSSLIMRVSDQFFLKSGVTDVQFNILALLRYYGQKGLSQQEISDRLVATKSNVVKLIDRLEGGKLVKRKPHPTDRRFNQVVLTEKGRRLLAKLEKYYFPEVERVMASVSEAEKKAMIEATGKMRDYLRKNWSGGGNGGKESK